MTPPVLATPLMSRGWHTKHVSRLVVHCMAEYVVNHDPQTGPIGRISAYAWLGAIGLSAHALIRPDGTVCECIPLTQRAFHAKGFNDGTVGVELLVPGDHSYDNLAQVLGWDLKAWAPAAALPAQPYKLAQYESVAYWLEKAAAQLGLGWVDVTAHDRIDPVRKFDPGPVFDWPLLEDEFHALRLQREAAPLTDPEG